ncbi:MAG: type IV pilus assembly protein PilM [Patescibacteria group bacterium]|nr:type IV pilus assembly protein PilM [Patescibacteria group bacterium]
MFDFPKKMAFGLDLSDRSLKIVQFKKYRDNLSLSHFVKTDIPSGIVRRGEIKKEKELINILKTSLKETKGGPLRNKRVVCSLPEEKVFIRVIQLPLMKEEEIAQAVRWEAEAHIPMAADEVYMDWQVIKSAINNPGQIDILVAAAPRELVDSYLSFLKNSGLRPIALEPESVAVVRSFIKDGESKPTVIVDIGTTGVNFVVFSDGAIRFTSHIRISGQLLEEAIAKNLKIGKKEAHQLKIKVGLDETKQKGAIYRALKPLIDDLVQQIGKYIDFHYDNIAHLRAKEKKIAQILLCGGDALLINLSSYLEQKLKIPVKAGSPLIGASMFSAKNKKIPSTKTIFSEKEILVYNTAIGLALNEND